MRTFVQNIFAAAIVLTAASVGNAQYSSPRGSGYSSGYTSPSSYASSVSYGYSNEIITNFSHGTLTSGQNVKGGSTVTTIDIQGKYLRTFNANIQIGGLAGLQSLSGTKSQTLLTALGIGVYNFDTNIKQSFFVEGGAGIFPVLNTTGDFESKFGLYVGGGKRFPIWERVSYIPTAAIVKKGDLDMGFDIQFLNFSIMF